MGSLPEGVSGSIIIDVEAGDLPEDEGGIH